MTSDERARWLGLGFAAFWLRESLPYLALADPLAPLAPAWGVALYRGLAAGCALALLAGSRRAALAWCQLAALLLGAALLACARPQMLVHPFGPISKSLSLALLLIAWRLPDRRRWWLGGVAVVWISEGLLPKLLFHWELELAMVPAFGLDRWLSPPACLRLMGAAQLASGLALLTLPVRWQRPLLACQLAALLLLPALVLWAVPGALQVPLGPLAKNAPILVASWILLRDRPDWR